MAAKIEKTIARLQQRIEEGNYYEAHQQLRVVASRYVKQENWTAAIDILYNGAQALLKAGQGGSGGDLCLFLIDVYKQGDIKSTSESKARLLRLIGMMSTDEPSRKRVINESILWSTKCSEFPAGDPELHHYIGALYAQEEEPYEAERHLLLGTKDSSITFTNLLYNWYRQDEPSHAPQYAARAVLGYLLLGNVRDATRSLDNFTTRLVEDNVGGKLSVQNVETNAADARIFPAVPLLNFLRLLCLAVQRGPPAADLWMTLRKHYNQLLSEMGTWDEYLDTIGEMYFGVQINRPRNFMADMMSSMFGGAPPQAAPMRTVEPPKPTLQADNLD